MAAILLDLSTCSSRGRREFALGGVAARPTKACAGQSYCELGANLHLTDANAALAHISRIFSTGMSSCIACRLASILKETANILR